MPVRVECDLPGLEGTWCDVADAWTLREVGELATVQDEAFYALIRRKVVACNIQLTTGEAITDPSAINDDALLDADIAVMGWLGRVLPLAVAKRRVLGNAHARLSSDANG